MTKMRVQPSGNPPAITFWLEEHGDEVYLYGKNDGQEGFYCILRIDDEGINMHPGVKLVGIPVFTKNNIVKVNFPGDGQR